MFLFDFLFIRKKSFPVNQTLNIGDYCVCPSESEDWYRGLIRQIDSDGNAVVFKIDYGDVQCIPIQFLRPLHVTIKISFLQLKHNFSFLISNALLECVD